MKEKIEILALIFAGLFFAFQVFDGSFFSNLKVSLSSKRVQHSDDKDYLVIKVDLEKGIIGSIILKNILIQNDCSETMYKNITTNKYKFSKDGLITKNRTPDAIALSSGDKVSFSEYFEVDSNKVCTITVVIGGNRKLWGNPQWISSLVSVPIQ